MLLLRIRLAELRGEQGELLGVHQQHFAAAIVALHLRVGGERPAVGLDVEFIVHHGQVFACGQRLDFMEVIHAFAEAHGGIVGVVHQGHGAIHHIRHGAAAVIALAVQDQKLIDMVHRLDGFQVRPTFARAGTWPL